MASHSSCGRPNALTVDGDHTWILVLRSWAKEQDQPSDPFENCLVLVLHLFFLHQIFHLLLLFCGFRCGSLGLFVAQPRLGATGRRVLCVIGSVSCHLHHDAGSTEQGAAAILPRAAFRGGYSVFFTNGPPGSHRQHHCVHQKHKGHQRCKGEQKQQDGQNQDARKGPRNRPHASGMTQTVEP